MVSALFDIEPLFESISPDSLLLTPNRRLAAHVHTAYAVACSQRGLQVWETPAILPLDEWLQNCWQQLIARDSNFSRQSTLLQPLQETLLWERIIRNDAKSVLLKPHATAKQAQSAYRILQLWETELNQDFYYHPDCARFAHWHKQFQQQNKQQGFISTATLPRLISEAFDEGLLNPPRHIILLGFQHLPPLQQRLIASSGASLQQHQPTATGQTIQQLACNDAAQELQAAACWAKHKLEANPQQRIGIIVPNLAQQRTQIEAALAAAFEPQYLLPHTARYQLPFNISAGVPLNQTPLVDSALLLLCLLRDEFSYQELYALLHSPFVKTGNESGYGAASQLELLLREGGWPVFDLESLHRILNNSPRLGTSYRPFSEAIDKALALKNQYQAASMDLLGWTAVFENLLQGFQWPCTERRLDSIEYQQLSRWQLALSEFSALATLCGEVRLNEALSLLIRVVGNIDFQAQSAETPMQMLGLLEGSGLQFDALWLVGMNDHLWPAAANPNPFIPINLQRQLNMPHASAERELEFARELLQGYLHSSADIVASYALQSDDQALRASTLIDSFETTTLAALGLQLQPFPHPYYQLEQDKVELQPLLDTSAPAVNLHSEAIRGGSAILKDQAACPFRAYANHRLSAQPLPEPGFHLNAAQRGIALHSALEALWQTLKDSAQLAASDETVLDEVIQQAVSRALTPLARQRQDLFGEVFISSETQRLSRLLKQWLAVEQARAPFTVLETEKTLLVSLQGLPLRVRIDRIDRLADGSLMLIDYKTGLCSAAKWQGERLEEPQLPLYSVTFAGVDADTGTEQPHVDTLAFAQINIDKQGFVGISAQQGVAPGIYSVENSRGWETNLSWADVNQQWQQSLQTLSKQFMRGYAGVDPLRNNTCQFCHLHALCRIHEQQAQANGETC